MKKRILAITLAMALTTVVFTGCSKDKAPVDDNKPATGVADEVKGDLTDGIYLIKTEVSDHGNFAMATLDVKDGQVSKLNYIIPELENAIINKDNILIGDMLLYEIIPVFENMEERLGLLLSGADKDVK